jgi:hypothetical protein
MDWLFTWFPLIASANFTVMLLFRITWALEAINSNIQERKD